LSKKLKAESPKNLIKILQTFSFELLGWR